MDDLDRLVREQSDYRAYRATRPGRHLPAARSGSTVALDAETTGDLQTLATHLDDPRPQVRREAIDALGGTGQLSAVAPLVRALEDRDGEVRYAAASGLGELGASEAIQPLIEALGDEDEEVRDRAARSLGQLDRQEAVGPLVEFATSEPQHSPGRFSAALALDRLGSAERRSEHWLVPPLAVWAIGLALFAGGVWLSQAHDAGPPAVVAALVGVAALLVYRLYAVRHERQHGIYAVDPASGESVWISAGLYSNSGDLLGAGGGGGAGAGFGGGGGGCGGGGGGGGGGGC
jgi:hypothetical protein